MMKQYLNKFPALVVCFLLFGATVFAGGKPKFEGAGKPRAEGDKPAFKEKKAAWKKKKR